MATHISDYLGEALGERVGGGDVRVMKDMVAAGFAGMCELFSSEVVQTRLGYLGGVFVLVCQS